MKLDTKKLGAKVSEYAVFIALVLLVVAMMIFADGFATSSNLLNLLRQAAFNGLIAFGMTLVILSDGIDLSVGSVFALAAIICAELIMAGTLSLFPCQVDRSTESRTSSTSLTESTSGR